VGDQLPLPLPLPLLLGRGLQLELARLGVLEARPFGERAWEAGQGPRSDQPPAAEQVAPSLRSG